MIATKKRASWRGGRADRREPSALLTRLAPAAMPAAPVPMLCTLVAEPFDNPAWIFEPKYDGLRVLGRFDGRQLTLLRAGIRHRRLHRPARSPRSAAANGRRP